MNEFSLNAKSFNKDDWNYCITCRRGWDIPLDFVYKEDCLMNKLLPKEQAIVDAWEYISVIRKESFTPDNLWVELDCKFETFGAPCITFSNELDTISEGLNVYRHHYEICGYKNGLNIWDVKNIDGKMVSTPMAKTYFKVPENEKITIRAEFDKGMIKGGIGDFSVALPFVMPEKFHIGFTACEGINSFYAIRFGKLREE